MPKLSKLALVVSCVDLKATEPVVRLRDLPSGKESDLEARYASWTRLLSEVPSDSLRPVRDLYRGVAWSAVRQLASGRDDFDIWVLSAGLGLVPLDYLAPSYGATFSVGAPDSVGASRAQARDWWRLHIQRAASCTVTAKAQSLSALATGYTSMVVALSASYFDAVREDVVTLLDCGSDILLVTVGENAIPFAKDRALRLPAGARAIVGGTLVSLLNRALYEAVSEIPEGEVDPQGVRRRLESIAAVAPAFVRPERSPMSDEGVARYITRLKTKDSGVSASAALSRLRADGFACEQRRFRRIFGFLVRA